MFTSFLLPVKTNWQAKQAKRGEGQCFTWIRDAEGQRFTPVSSLQSGLEHVAQGTKGWEEVGAAPSIVTPCFTLWNLCHSYMVLTLPYIMPWKDHALLRETKILSK